jgi:hypothetical protein
MAPAGPGIRGMSAYHALPSRAALRLGLAGGRGLGPGRRVPALPIFGGAMAEERRGQAQRDRDQLTPDEVDVIVQPGFEYPLDRQPVQARPQIVEAVDNVIAAAQRIARFKLGLRRVDLADAKIDRAREARVEQQKPGDPRRRRALETAAKARLGEDGGAVWLDRTHPALGNRSPRVAAVVSVEGFENAIELLQGPRELAA